MFIHPNLSAILFDLDGTLLDTAPDLAFALNKLLQNHGRQTLPYEKIRPFASAGTLGLLGLGFEITKEHPAFAPLRLEYLQIYHDHLSQQTTLFPGMATLLEKIEAKGFKWGVVTNKLTNLAQELLVHFKLAQRAACIVGADIVAHHKPAPDGLLLACELMQTSPKQCIYVGDAKRDVDAAHAANMPAVAALYGYIEAHDDPKLWKADQYIETPLDLLPLLF